MADAARVDSRDALSRFVLAGLATSIVDGLFSSVLSVAAYGSTVSRLFQGVAATVVGNAAFDGGMRTTLLGLLMHCAVAFTWSAIFVFVLMRSVRIRQILAAPYGVFRVASVYGPFIWTVMSVVVIPVLLRRPPAITFRWWVQFVGHFPFVGVPMVTFGSRGARPIEESARRRPWDS